MKLKIINATIKQIENDRILRFNYKTLSLSSKLNYLFVKEFPHCRIKDLFYMINGFAFSSKDYLDEGIPLVRIGDLNNDVVGFGTAFLPDDYLNIFTNYQIKKNDILVSLTGDGRLKIAIAQNDNMLLNQRIGALRPLKNLNIMFYYYLLNTDIVKTQFEFYSNGKSQLNISPKDFLNIKVPIVSEKQIAKLMGIIAPFEVMINALKAQIKPIQSIIDDVFSREFGLDYTQLDEIKTRKRFDVNISAFSNNPDLRFSAKFHRPAGEFVMEQLQGITSKKIKHYLAEPITLGASVSPNDYSEDGEFYYISMATIKNWHFESEDAKFVSKPYSDDKRTKTVTVNDILLARSGEGTIGKVALIDNEELQGVFADFTMRIRLTNYNHLFAYYYFRTSFFQYLIEVYKKGLGNNTNIFPSAVREFPIPDFSLIEQQRIVNEIKTGIDKQDSIKAKIEELRVQIDTIIENSLVNLKKYKENEL